MEQLDFSKGAPPLYTQIYQLLKDKITGGVYECGQNIPTELELQESYGVSRITVRQAILALEQEGLVVRTRGKGTVVSRPEKIEELLTRIKSFTEEMRERGITSCTKSAEISKVRAGEKLAGIFSCREDDELYRLLRVRAADGKAIVLFDTYLSGRYPLPLDSGSYTGSLYQLLEEHGIRPPVGIKEKFEAVLAGPEVSEALEIDPGAPVMKRTRTSYDAGVQVQEYTVSYYNAADYAYVVYAGVTKETQEGTL